MPEYDPLLHHIVECQNKKRANSGNVKESEKKFPNVSLHPRPILPPSFLLKIHSVLFVLFSVNQPTNPTNNMYLPWQRQLDKTFKTKHIDK